MHVVIINGSPRVQKLSNTDKIIASFGKGLQDAGGSYELYSLSNHKEWEAAREAFSKADNIIMAMPLYVESAPSMFLEFLDSLPTTRQRPAQLSFILQSGFAEGNQLRCGEHFLMSLPSQLGCSYGGCLLKGDNFSLRLLEGKQLEKLLKPYEAMGRSFGNNGNFLTEDARKFVGLERFPFLLRVMIGLIFKLYGDKRWTKIAKTWGCNRPLDDRPY